MFKVIEIIDSDDDGQAEHTLSEGRVEKVTEMEQNSGTADSNSRQENAINETGPTTAIPTIISAKKAGRNRSRRKSMHQPMRASPEMQFETIALDDEEEEATTKVQQQQEQKQHKEETKSQEVYKSTKTSKIAPKILNSRISTVEQLVNAACDNMFIEDTETNALLRQIAEERVRVNYMLTCFSMPDINFSLYTQSDRLQFQFEERLRQRKIRHWEAKCVLEKQKRHNSLPNKHAKHSRASELGSS